MTKPQKQDAEQLRLLSLFHYIIAGLTALVSLFPVVHLIMGILFIVAPEIWENSGEAPPKAFGWIFIIVAAGFILFGWTVAILMVVAGRKIAQRKSRSFCIGVAAIECLFFPLGTALGIFTIIVLVRDSVADLFEGNTRQKASEEFEESF